MDPLVRIKSLVRRGEYILTLKAQDEMEDESLTEPQVIESILAAPAISKTLRSTSAGRTVARELLYVLKGRTAGGVVIYTKGVIRRIGGADVF